MALKAPYLASAAILYNSRGREPSTRPGGVSRSRTEPWQPRDERPGGWLNPHARQGVSTFGNTGKHRAGPDPDRVKRRLNPQARQDLSLKTVNPSASGLLSSSFSSTTGTPALTRASASTPLPLIFFPLKVPS